MRSNVLIRSPNYRNMKCPELLRHGRPDVILYVSGVRLYVHSHITSIYSTEIAEQVRNPDPFLGKMLIIQNRRSLEGACALLDTIYPPQKLPNSKTLFEVCEIAEELGVPLLAQKLKLGISKRGSCEVITEGLKKIPESLLEKYQSTRAIRGLVPKILYEAFAEFSLSELRNLKGYNDLHPDIRLCISEFRVQILENLIKNNVTMVNVYKSAKNTVFKQFRPTQRTIIMGNKGSNTKSKCGSLPSGRSKRFSVDSRGTRAVGKPSPNGDGHISSEHSSFDTDRDYDSDLEPNLNEEEYHRRKRFDTEHYIRWQDNLDETAATMMDSQVKRQQQREKGGACTFNEQGYNSQGQDGEFIDHWYSTADFDFKDHLKNYNPMTGRFTAVDLDKTGLQAAAQGEGALQAAAQGVGDDDGGMNRGTVVPSPNRGVTIQLGDGIEIEELDEEEKNERDLQRVEAYLDGPNGKPVSSFRDPIFESSDSRTKSLTFADGSRAVGKPRYDESPIPNGDDRRFLGCSPMSSPTGPAAGMSFFQSHTTSRSPNKSRYASRETKIPLKDVERLVGLKSLEACRKNVELMDRSLGGSSSARKTMRKTERKSYKFG